MSGGDTNAARSINRSSIGPPDPFNTLLQSAGLAAGQDFGLTGLGGSPFGQGLGFNADVFGGGGASSPQIGPRGGFNNSITNRGTIAGGRLGRGRILDGGRILGGRGSPAVPSPVPGGVTNNPGQGGIIGNASGVLNDTILGRFLRPETNPFLEGTFNRAADLTQNRLSSEFAGSGRNLGAALPARSQELQTLASNIFGGNFQAERNRQMQGIFGAQQFDPLNQLISRLTQLTPLAGRNQISETTQDSEFKPSALDRGIQAATFLFGGGL